MFKSLFNPARAAFLPAVVGEDCLLAANSVSQTSRIVFNLLGTGAAGALAAVSDTFAPAFIVDFLTFFVSFLLISRSRTSGAPEKHAVTKVWSELTGGFKVMLGDRPLRAVLISLSVTMFRLGAGVHSCSLQVFWLSGSSGTCVGTHPANWAVSR